MQRKIVTKVEKRIESTRLIECVSLDCDNHKNDANECVLKEIKLSKDGKCSQYVRSKIDQPENKV